MGLFDKLFGGNKGTENILRTSSNHSGRLNYNPTGSSEYGFYANCYAKYENGIVYNCSTMPSVSDIKIGYYEKDTNGNYVVWNMDRDEKVGMIDGDALGAAAACVCLSYEYVQDGKFNSYYYDWMK